jgi:hypothetical protein
VPALQSVQLVEPAVPVKVPASHAAHESAPVPLKKPAVHAVHALEPAGA